MTRFRGNLFPCDFDRDNIVEDGTKVFLLDKKVGCQKEYSSHLNLLLSGVQDYVYVNGHLIKEVYSDNIGQPRKTFKIVIYMCSQVLSHHDGDYFARSDFVIYDDMSNEGALTILPDIDHS